MMQFNDHVRFGDAGHPLHFSGANGFAPATYQQFLGRLGDCFRVVAYTNRPLWSADDPWETMVDWYPFAHDMITFLEAQALPPVIGMGHSLGAVVTMLAAALRPDLFASLVIIEPPLQMPETLAKWEMMRSAVDPRNIPMVKNALGRYNDFATVDEAYERYRAKKFFAGWSDLAIRDYVTHGLVAVDGRYRLAFRPRWEGWIFSTIPFDVWERLDAIQLPILAVRGANTDVLAADAWMHWQTNYGKHTNFVERSDVGHMLPFEAPSDVANQIIEHYHRRSSLLGK